MTKPNVAPHCKDYEHLRVDLVASPTLRPVHTSTPTATRLANCTCHNTTPAEQPWVIVISIRKTQPLNGLHVLPDAALWLSTHLRQAVRDVQSTTDVDVVTLLHTNGGQFIAFASFTPTDALTLADAIETAAAA